MTLQEKFQSILANNAFDQLTPYCEPVSWSSMTADERALLGLLFVKKGEHLLKMGDQKAVESFEMASQISPGSARLFFQQALAYSSQGLNIRSLKAADQALERATELDPNLIPAWGLWGHILCRMGNFYGDSAYMYQAVEKYAIAERVAVQLDSQQLATVHWQFALCLYQIGKLSGEAVDYVSALEKFRLASAAGAEGGQFFNDYGNLLIDLASLIGRKDLLEEAVKVYQSATRAMPGHYEVWTNLACTYKRLYEIDHLLENFQAADQHFNTALQLNPSDALSWLHWAVLYLDFGKHLGDLERLKSSLEKFEEANNCEEGIPQTFLNWGEAQLLVASYAEDLDGLRAAEAKIARALKALSDKPEAWYIYALCLEAYGRYFASEKYYLQAIEKYEYALGLVTASALGIKSLLLNGLALVYFELGDLLSDHKHLAQSLSYFKMIAPMMTPLSPHVLNDWGLTLLKLGELKNDKNYLEEALHKFEEAIGSEYEVNRGAGVELEWLYNYGCTLDLLGDYHGDSTYYERAIQVLAHVLKTDPTHPDVKYNLALAFCHLAELNADMESYHHSIELFQKLCEEDPEDDAAWNDYGYALLNLAYLVDDPADTEEAATLFSHAEKKFHQAIALGNVSAYYNLACLHACQGAISEALLNLERAEQSDALPPIEELLSEAWLDSLRNEPPYRLLISRLLNNPEELGGLAP